MTDPAGKQKMIEHVAPGAWIKTFEEGTDNGSWGRVHTVHSLTGDQTGRKYTELFAKTVEGEGVSVREPNNTPVTALTAKQAAAAGLELP